MSNTILPHSIRRDNPHNVTKDQVELSHIENYPMATREEIMALVRDDRYIDVSDTDAVDEAFTKYMISLGILKINNSASFFDPVRMAWYLEGGSIGSGEPPVFVTP